MSSVETDLVRRIADAVLYEGYLLWPYRKSALKNQQRFTFGGVYPPAWDDRSSMRVQVLLEDSERAQVEVRVRFLQVVRRQVLRSGADGEATEPVEELEAGGERWVSWDEVVEREVGPGAIEVEAGEALEEVPGGAVRRSWRGLRGEVSLERERVRPGLWRVSVKITNTTPWASGSKRGAAAEHTSPAIGAPVAGEGRNEREDALRQTFCSTHAVLRASGGGRWVSQTDPPTGVRAEAEACENDGVWPVLVGEEDDRSTLLASPIILCDYPEIAPESPGELFDSGEIDQMLVLNILAMTDEERREMRDSDPRARAILERTEALSNEEIMRLHGAVREFGLVRAR